MRHFMGLVGIILAAFASGPSLAEQADINAAARGVVRIVLIEVDPDSRRAALVGHGTGFAVTRDRILTNAHVVADALGNSVIRIGVIPPQGTDRWFARITAISPGNDLALIELSDEGALPPTTLFTGAVPDGATIVAVGYPGSVDRALGLDANDMITPTSPVKTRGTVSGGRSAKAFDTILHNAAIGTGSSGGPLLDACGRVLGVNSFGTIAGQGDSEFYFAVSMREVMRFLTKAGIQPSVTGVPCRSIADLDEESARRQAAEADAEQRAHDKQAAALRDAEDEARLEIIAERENGMALAGIALILALGCAGAAFHYSQRDGKGTPIALAGGLALLFLAGAIAAWLDRPDLADARERAHARLGFDNPVELPTKNRAPLTGSLVCVLDPERSRVTVSPALDVPFSWSEFGCVNNRTQYGRDENGWSRILVPNEDQTVTLAFFDPEGGIYRTERYLLDLETMDELRTIRAEIEAPSCSADVDAARRFGLEQERLKALLPEQPNERLVYACHPDR